MRVCLVGGIFDKPEAYRQHHRYTPETILREQLLDCGADVHAFGHTARIDPSRYDIVHVHHLGRAILPAATRKGASKLVLTFHDGPLLCGIGASATRRAAFRFALARADAVVALSEVEKRFLSKRARGEGIVATIPNGIPTHIYHPANQDSDSEPGRLLFVGQLLDMKGVDILLGAISELAENQPVAVKFIHQSEGLKKDYQKLATSLGIDRQVEFAGARNPEELADEYRSSRLLVLPSKAECFPSVILEALLCATPVVASDVGGIPEQVGPYGCLVQHRDPRSLAEAIRKALSQHDTYRRRLLRDHAQLAEDYSPSRMGSRHLKLYRSLLS